MSGKKKTDAAPGAANGQAVSASLARAVSLHLEGKRKEALRELNTAIENGDQGVDIYAAKGFEGEFLNRVVETITAKRDVWLATMMDEELHLSPVDASDIFRSAVIITIATLIGHNLD